MTCPVNTPLCITQGDDKKLRFTFKLADGSVVDLTNNELKLIITKSKSTANPILVVPITEYTDPANGVVTIDLDHAKTEIAQGTYFYMIKWTNAGGRILTIMKGTLLIDWSSYNA